MQFQLPLSLPTPTHISYDYSDAGGYIAVDANPYHILLAHTISDGVVLDTLEAKPHQILRVVNFVRSRKHYFPELELTGVRKDRWPPGLLPALVQEFGPICWVPETLLKHTVKDFRHSTQLLKFFRATFIAACAQEAIDSCEPRVQLLLTRWKQAMLTEMAYSLDVGPPPDTPF
jgi:hypothetical protein